MLAAVGIGTWIAGETVLRQTVSSEADGGGVRYQTRQVALDPGEYDIHLRIDRPPGIMRLGYSFVLTSPEHPELVERGSLKAKSSKSSSSSSRRRRASTSKLVEIDAKGLYSFVVSFDDKLDRRLEISIRRVYADYRVPLYLGIALAAAGVLLSPQLRSKAREQFHWFEVRRR